MKEVEEPAVTTHQPEPAAVVETEDYEGTPGNTRHITRVQTGHVPLSLVADLPGARGERPGEHRNMWGPVWEEFVDDIRTNGIRDAIFVTVDPGIGARISEGNHRRDAAAAAALGTVPVHIRYFGHAERAFPLVPAH